MNKTSDESIADLLQTMKKLRSREGGCPWDLAQDFASISAYTIEEAYEVADAISRKNYADLKEELGDLLFQVVFHAQLALEEGRFDFAEVAAGVNAKMRRRHPHVFADLSVQGQAEVNANWEQIKAAELAEKAAQSGLPPDASVLATVPAGMPPLMRAAKLGRKASSVGFDWPDVTGVWAKIDEELVELREAIVLGEPNDIRAELGDLLFAVVNLARHLKVEPDRALRETNTRFEARFRHVEQAAAAQGQAIADCDEQALDQLWEQAKTVLRSAS